MIMVVFYNPLTVLKADFYPPAGEKGDARLTTRFDDLTDL
jgi:hypothetical protein